MAIVHYEFEENGDWLVATLKGSLDASNSTRFGDDLQKYLDAGGVKNIAFEVSGLETVASAGLRVVMTAIKYSRPKGGKFALVAPNQNVRQLMKIANMGAFMDIVDSRSDLGPA